LTMASISLLCVFAASGGLDSTRPECPWRTRGSGFEKDSRLSSLIGHCKAAAPRAVGRVEEELGIRPGRLEIQWVLDVSLPAPSAPGKPFEAGRTLFAGDSVEVILPARKYLSDPSRLESVLAHEATHAVLASAIGSRQAYEAVPRWAREGLALLVGQDGEVSLREAAAYAVYRGEPAASFIRGLSSPDATYAECFAAACELRDRLGAEGMKAFSRDLAGGSGIERLLERHLGLKLERFALAARERARKRVSELIPGPAEEAFRSALEARSRGAMLEAREALEALLVRDPRGALAPTARFVLAKELLVSAPAVESAGKARGHLLRLLELPGDAWRPEALLLLGAAEETLGRQADAHRSWEQVLEVFGEDAEASNEARRKLEARR